MQFEWSYMEFQLGSDGMGMGMGLSDDDDDELMSARRTLGTRDEPYLILGMIRFR